MIADDFLRPALGRPHDACRAHRLVRRDQDEVADTAIGCRPSQRFRAEHVVADTFEAVLLHEMNMLVGGAMIDRLDIVLADDATNKVAIRNRAEHRHQREERLALQLPAYLVKAMFVGIQQNQPCRLELRDDAAESRAD
jgi:hypothetical protein